jgi:hypothetical protein
LRFIVISNLMEENKSSSQTNLLKFGLDKTTSVGSANKMKQKFAVQPIQIWHCRTCLSNTKFYLRI